MIDMLRQIPYKTGTLRFSAANEHKDKPARHQTSGFFAFQ